ncbi:T9SS type A sorting domain-containing protein [Cellulophaga sp. L1A9]|uniref:T9SS type A sorting domain-containing protein n=1 Tax=Cellulophaga sp. L1A9 TaxID=2686362 RepID=UPI001E36AC70|nr:T9SS type A sorting domain-containing protein [Cellulophaga sp. L1A9]
MKILKGDGAFYTTEIELNEEDKTFEIRASDFKNEANNSADFTSLKVVLFNMHSTDGSVQEKEMTISEIDFNNRSEIEEEVIIEEETTTKALVYPNPLEASTNLYYTSNTDDTYTLELFSLNGILLGNHTQEGTSVVGQNEITIPRKNLSPGVYFYKLASSSQIWSGKIVVK